MVPRKRPVETLKPTIFSYLAMRFSQWFKWLSPGLAVKRWLFLSAIGVVLTSLGLAISIKLTPVFYVIQFVERALQFLAQLLPSHISVQWWCCVGCSLSGGGKLGPWEPLPKF